MTKQYAEVGYKLIGEDDWKLGVLGGLSKRGESLLTIAIGVGDPTLTSSYIEVESMADGAKWAARLNIAHLAGQREQLKRVREALGVKE